MKAPEQDVRPLLPPPVGLSEPAERLWREISEEWVLRPDEQRLLEDACREVDLIDRIADSMAGAPLTVEGSQGQRVVHPLLPELRAHRSTLRTLLRALSLPDDARADGARSAAGRALAMARWSG